MKVTCSSCKRTLNVPENLIGKTVACPACKASIKIEEQLTFADQGEKSSDSQRSLGMNRQQGGAGLPGTCSGCGFPIPANKVVCNRCGMNRETGLRDESGIGYKASDWQKSAGVRGKMLTGIIGIAVVIGIIVGVQSFRGWASKVTEEKKKEAEEKAKKKRPRHLAKPAPKPAPPKTGTPKTSTAGEATTAAATPDADKPDAVKPVPKPEADITDVFEEAYVLLIDPLPSTSQRGASRVKAIGARAIPLLAAKIAQEEDVSTRTICVTTLARFRTKEAAEALIGLLGDKEHRVRDAAITGVVSQGHGVSELIGPVINAESARTRVSAIRVVNSAKLTDHAAAVIKRLKDDDEPEVRQEAVRALGGSLAGEAVFGLLVRALSDSSSDVAYAAAEALAGQSRALNKVVDALNDDTDGESEARYRRLFLLGWPILASGDVAAGTLLAKRVCSEKPIPELVRYITSMLAAGNSVASRDAVRQALNKKDFVPPTLIAAMICLASPDRRVRGAAENYAAGLTEITYRAPLIACMGMNDVRFAVSCSRILAGARGDGLTSDLRRSVKGVNLQRRTLASVALALQGDDTGIDILEAVATGAMPLESPIPGLAAYGYASVKKGDRKEEFYEASRSTTDNGDKLYFAAAAARSGHKESLDRLRAMLRDRKMGTLRFEAARLLSEMKDSTSQEALMLMLTDTDGSAQLAAARALGRLGKEEIIPKLLAVMPRLYDSARGEVRRAIGRFGQKAVPHVSEALKSDDPRVQTAALEVIHELGPETPQDIVKVLGVLLQNTRLPARTQEAIKKAVVAATGARPKPEWTWRDWVEACGVRPGELVKELEFEAVKMNWINMMVPKTWDRNEVSASGGAMPGTPAISITQEFDHLVSGMQKNFWKPQHSSLADFKKNRINLLAMENMGANKWVPRKTAAVQNAPAPGLGGYKSAAFRVIDKEAGRTTYYVLSWFKQPKTYCYIEVSFSADVADYKDYQALFEQKLARTIRIQPKTVKLRK
jgi:HEAT repeat protein